jgi:hypothetical protein
MNLYHIEALARINYMNGTGKVAGTCAVQAAHDRQAVNVENEGIPEIINHWRTNEDV